jgi:hypothetical protein
MDISEIARHCWEQRLRLPFHSEDAWVPDTFKKEWFDAIHTDHWVKGRECSGWYWFELDLAFEDIQKLERPIDLPDGGCDFGKVATTNIELFNDYLCKHKSQLNVVYNGHEKNVLGRIRSHFALNNPLTGALGITRYPLNASQWHVSVYLMKHVENDQNLRIEDKDQILRLSRSKTGRAAVEQMWRTIYGWPVLCKE